MLNIFELKTLKGFLRNAHEVMTDARDLVQPSDTDQAARIKNITHRLSDEINVMDRKIAEAERLEGGPANDNHDTK
jgi:hypothetical protein